jgi:ABC-type lipopolysaccharide export system ATPase subunit
MLAAKGLHKQFGPRAVVRGVDLSVERGEILGLLGPNGAGKTTTFYMVVGLVRPDAGDVWLDDDSITHLPVHVRARRGIGYLAQDPSVFRGLSVEQNIQAVLEAVGAPGALDGDHRRAPRRVRAGARTPAARRDALGRRAPSGRDRPCACDAAVVHPAR